MRWEELFEDLESQAEASERELAEDELADVEVAEQGRIVLADRIRARVGERLVIGVDGDSHAGRVLDAGRSWVLLAGAGRDVLVPAEAIRWVDGVGRSAPEQQGAELRIGLGHVLRGIAQEEARVSVVAGGRTVVGVIDRVGRDHLEIDVEGVGPGFAVPFGALTSVALQHP